MPRGRAADELRRALRQVIAGQQPSPPQFRFDADGHICPEPDESLDDQLEVDSLWRGDCLPTPSLSASSPGGPLSPRSSGSCSQGSAAATDAGASRSMSQSVQDQTDEDAQCDEQQAVTCLGTAEYLYQPGAPAIAHYLRTGGIRAAPRDKTLWGNDGMEKKVGDICGDIGGLQSMSRAWCGAQTMATRIPEGCGLSEW